MKIKQYGITDADISDPNPDRIYRWKMVGGDRGRVVGAIAVIGAIMSDTSITMLMAAMVMGPLAGFCIKN